MRRAGRALIALGLTAIVSCNQSEVNPTAGVLQISNVPDFGRIMLARSSTFTVHVQNISRAPIQLNDVGLMVPGLPDYSLGGGVPTSLASGEEREFNVTFAPTELGPRRSQLIFKTNATVATQIMPLAGIGILGQAQFDPKALDFGDVGVGSSYALGISFTNTTDDPAEVTVAPPGGPDAASFSVSQLGNIAVPPQSKVSLEVRFRPQRTGGHTASLDIQSCPSCAVETVPMTGNGIAANLTVEPSPLDFGLVTPLEMKTKTLTVTNHGTRPATIEVPTLKQDTNGPYALGPTMQVVLTQNQTEQIDVTFAPKETGQVNASLRIPTDDDGSPVLVVPITGSGAGPAIEVSPTELGFPRTAVGLSVTKQIAVRNVGLDPMNVNPLVLTNIEVTPGRFTFQAMMAQPTIPVGRQQYLFVTYHPIAEGADEGTLTIHSNDPLRPVVTIPLTGSASTLPDCSYEVVPPQLDFGSVNSGTNATLWFQIRNVGATECAVANVATGPGTPIEFYVEPISTRMLQPGEVLVIPVYFSPTGPGNWNGEVTFDTTSVGAPQGRVALTGAGVPACFNVQPQWLDFGTIGLMCKAPTMTVQLQNACTVPVDVTGAFVGPSPTDAFAVTGGGGGVTLAPGGQSTVAVRYGPKVAGTDNGALYVQTDLVPAPYLVSLTGEAVDQLLKTDTFQLPPIQKVDVLWVIDNSGSMSNKQAQLSANAGRFIDRAISSGIDFHVAVTTTGSSPFTGGISQCPGGGSGGERGRFFPVDNSKPRILTPTTPNVRSAFAANALVGICHYIEEGMEGMRRALSPPLINSADDATTAIPNDGNAGFLREDARLYVVWVSDQEDQMPDASSATGDSTNSVPLQDYVRFLYSLKPTRPDMVAASAIIGLPGSCAGAIEGVGKRYLDFVQQVGGKVADICADDWSPVIDAIAEDAFKPQINFPVTAPPDGRSVKVKVNGKEIPASENGHQNWRFDPTIGMYGAVVFDPAAAPGPNATVTVTYALPCPP